MTITRLKRKFFVLYVRSSILMSDLHFKFERSMGGTFYTPISEARSRNKLIAEAKRKGCYVVLAGRRY